MNSLKETHYLNHLNIQFHEQPYASELSWADILLKLFSKADNSFSERSNKKLFFPNLIV